MVVVACCSFFYVASCLLFRCFVRVDCCVLFVVSCMHFVVPCHVLFVVCWLLCVGCCLSFVRCALFGACSLLLVVLLRFVVLVVVRCYGLLVVLFVV